MRLGKPFNRRKLFLAALMALVLAGLATVPAMADQEALYREIVAQFMAPDRCGKTLADCPASVSENMRQEIAGMVNQGKGKDEIIQYFTDLYGLHVLAAPPKEGFFWTAWLLPVVALIAGWVVMQGFIVSRRRSVAPAQRSKKKQVDLDDPLLDDRIMAEVKKRL